MENQQQQQLEFAQKALDLVLAIDDIRDLKPEPFEMMNALARVLVDFLRTDICLICLVDQETKALELEAVHDPGNRFVQLSEECVHELDLHTKNTEVVLLWQADQIPDQLRRCLPDENLHMVLMPISLKEKRLGLLAFARLDCAFTEEDLDLIELSETQVDSAVVQCYEYYTIQQRNKELETIYRIDNIRDQHILFDDMLEAVLRALHQIIQIECGFIMLFNNATRTLELRKTTEHSLFITSPHQETIQRIANESLDKARLVWYNDLGTALRSIICMPLILEQSIIGVLGVVNRRNRAGFNSEDRRLLNAIASQIDTAIFESLEQRRLRQVLGRSLDPRVMQRLLTNADSGILKSERSVITVLYSDIRGSTALAERIEPDVLCGFINDYLGRMAEIILAHEGTLDKFVGDEVMALFGAPIPQSDHALRAIQVALEMQQKHQSVMDTWERKGVERSPIGIGIATGELIAGEFGCEKRTDYTVIGRAANLGARICSAAKAGQVLISQATYDLVKDQVEALPISAIHFKGFAHDVTVYDVQRIL